LSRKTEHVNDGADKLFEHWASSAAAIQDPALREQSERRLAEARASYAEIRPVGQKATELCEPFMKALRREIDALAKSLDAKSLAQRQPAAQDLNARANALVRRIDDQITATTASISYLRS
jgi:hypothetical protein